MKGDGSGTAELQPQQIQCCSYSTYSKNLSVKRNAGVIYYTGPRYCRVTKHRQEERVWPDSIPGKQSSQTAWRTLGKGTAWRKDFYNAVGQREESTLSIGDPKAWKTHFRMSQLTHTTQSTGAQENENITLAHRRGHHSELWHVQW